MASNASLHSNAPSAKSGTPTAISTPRVATPATPSSFRTGTPATPGTAHIDASSALGASRLPTPTVPASERQGSALRNATASVGLTAVSQSVSGSAGPVLALTVPYDPALAEIAEIIASWNLSAAWAHSTAACRVNAADGTQFGSGEPAAWVGTQPAEYTTVFSKANPQRPISEATCIAYWRRPTLNEGEPRTSDGFEIQDAVSNGGSRANSPSKGGRKSSSTGGADFNVWYARIEHHHQVLKVPIPPSISSRASESRPMSTNAAAIPITSRPQGRMVEQGKEADEGKDNSSTRLMSKGSIVADQHSALQSAQSMLSKAGAAQETAEHGSDAARTDPGQMGTTILRMLEFVTSNKVMAGEVWRSGAAFRCPRATCPQLQRFLQNYNMSQRQADGAARQVPSMSNLSAATHSMIAPFLYDPEKPSPQPPDPFPKTGVGSTTSTSARPGQFTSQPFPTNEVEEEDFWEAISSRVLPLFLGEGLSCAIEELNFFLRKYCDQQLYGTILEELKELLREGVRLLTDKFLIDITYSPSTDVNVGSSLFLTRWAEIWSFYFSVVLPYLQSVFLPLQMEIKGSRLVSSVRTLVLLSFRDIVVFPRAAQLKACTENLVQELVTSCGSKRESKGITSPHGLSDNSNPGSSPALMTSREKASIILQMFLVLGGLPPPQPGTTAPDQLLQLEIFQETQAILKAAFIRLRKPR